MWRKLSNTFQGSLHVLRVSLDGVSGDLFDTRPKLWAKSSFLLLRWSPGTESRVIGFDLKRYFWVTGSKGLSQLSSLLLRLQTCDASFSATAQNIGVLGSE